MSKDFTEAELDAIDELANEYFYMSFDSEFSEILIKNPRMALDKSFGERVYFLAEQALCHAQDEIVSHRNEKDDDLEDSHSSFLGAAT